MLLMTTLAAILRAAERGVFPPPDLGVSVVPPPSERESCVEVPPNARHQGHGRRLALAARALIPPTNSIWAQITPGNAASLRAFLAAGYQPVGSEALLLA